jgi:hypothetical protein
MIDPTVSKIFMPLFSDAFSGNHKLERAAGHKTAVSRCKLLASPIYLLFLYRAEVRELCQFQYRELLGFT